MTRGRNKVIKSFTQNLFNDSWTWYFWTYYFQLGKWMNSQSIIVVPPCCAYPKISIPWIKVETLMIQTISCGYYVSCCRFVDVGALISATFKPGHAIIHSILPWGIETLAFFGDKRASRSTNCLVSVEAHNNSYKTLHAHNWNEKMQVHQKQGCETYCEGECWKGHIDPSHPHHPWDRLFKQNCPCMLGTEPTTSKYDIKGPTFLSPNMIIAHVNSICFVLACKIRFFTSFIALWLSHNNFHGSFLLISQLYQ
jgi:hypothetical protein